MRLLPRILPTEEEEEQRLEQPDPETLADKNPQRIHWGWPAAVAASAAIPRLVYLFVFTDPENAGHGFTDAYHHWQIAYLTKEIGIFHGPRLWDMRGVEYFWGPMHPMLMDLLFFVSGSPDIILARMLSLAFGSLAVVLIFLLCHRYWGLQVAVAASAFAALSPVSVFNDVAGMVEPIAISLLLLGIWLTPRRGFLAGVAWGFAAMARVEAWLFAAGLVVAALIGRRTALQRFPVLAGWAIVMGLYFKFLLDQTGNPIYPLYWNFKVVALGSTETSWTLTPEQQLLRIPMAVIVLVSAAGLAWSLWRRPPAYLLLTFGFGYWVFQAGTLGFTAYLLHSTEWMERRFEFPLDFAAILVAVFLFKMLPRHITQLRSVAWAAAAAALIAVQIFWIPIQHAYLATEPGYQEQVRLGRAIGQVYGRPEFRGGVIGMPGNAPTLVYTIVRDGGVPGAKITSEFYDPFYYLPPGYHYREHQKAAGVLLQCWLSDTHTRLLLLAPPDQFNVKVAEYEAFIADNPAWFIDTGVQLGDGWQIVGVNVPFPSQGDCARGRANAGAS